MRGWQSRGRSRAGAAEPSGTGRAHRGVPSPPEPGQLPEPGSRTATLGTRYRPLGQGDTADREERREQGAKESTETGMEGLGRT